MAELGDLGRERAADPRSPVLELDQDITTRLRDDSFPTAEFGAPLAASLIPWIDRGVEDGQTREEWKGMSETNKILQSDPVIPVDGICVRVPAMRCHSQALTAPTSGCRSCRTKKRRRWPDSPPPPSPAA